MSKKTARRNRPPQPGRSVLTAASSAAQPAASGLWVVLGGAFLAASAGAALLLVIEHFGALRLPGCGEGGACEKAAASVWGKVPLGRFKWPVSYLGLTYFGSMLAAWVGSGGGIGRLLRWVARLGALVSLGFCAIIAVEKLLCMYCLASHVGNFAFWAVSESTRRGSGRPGRALGLFAGSFVLVTAVLGVLNTRHLAAIQAAAELELSQTLGQLVEDSNRRRGDTAPTTDAQTAPAPGVETLGPASRPATAPTSAPATDTAPAERKPFTGRWRVGPENAPIRIVIFTDYQCPDCYKVEQQMAALIRERQDISVSVKHFPFCTECNPVAKRTLHENACWAARAAEAAGLLWGSAGFFKMHEWLFSRKGTFQTEAELNAGIRALGYDPTGFVAVMSGEQALRNVQEDCREGGRLGLLFTPMVFINGVELRGILAPDALRRAVEQLAATNPPPGSPLDDIPPPALDKFLADWQDQKPYERATDSSSWKMGPDEARVKVLVWGDYQDPFTAEVDATIRAFVSSRTDAQYTFRMYPFSNECNPFLNDKRFEHSCRTARAAEAAGRLGGVEVFWKMHAWLMAHRTDYSDAGLRAAAVEMGLEPEALLAEMESTAVAKAIDEDIRAGKGDGLRFIPRIIINGRWLQRFTLEGENVVRRALEAAAAQEQ